MLFGEEWANWKGIFSKNNTLFVTAKCEQHPYRPDTYALKLINVEFLSEVKSQKIEKLTVTADMSSITEKFVSELSSLLLSNPGNVELCFNVKDDQDQSYVLLTSPNIRISVNSELLDYLNSVPSMEFSIN